MLWNVLRPEKEVESRRTEACSPIILSSQAEVVSVAHLTLLRDREEAASCVSPALPAPNTSGRLRLKHLVNTEHAQGVRLFTTLAMAWLELHPFWDPELNGRPGNCPCKGLSWCRRCWLDFPGEAELESLILSLPRLTFLLHGSQSSPKNAVRHNRHVQNVLLLPL